MKTMIKLSFVMAAYAVVACVALAFVYIATAPKIAAAAQEELNASLRVVFSDASTFEDVTADGVGSGAGQIAIDRAYLAKKDGTTVGMVIQATGPTYKTSTVLVAVGMDRRIIGIKLLANSDTPGLGTKTAEPGFAGQFASKSVDDAFAVKADVQAISGATISSRGVAAIVRVAGRAAGNYLAAKAGGAVAPEGAASGGSDDGSTDADSGASEDDASTDAESGASEEAN
ncbi:MAG TPA: FMN-binding protein [Treponemataceae bacterium]|nr:FMN-binding protein [Treponemataceae bacterium]